MHFLAMMAGQPWGDFVARLNDLAHGAQRGGLYLGTALLLLLIGCAVGALASRLTRAALRSIRFNDGVRRLLGIAGTGRHEPASLAAWAVNWLIIAVAGFFALEVLGVNLHDTIGDRMSDVLPRIITSALLFVVGALLAMLFGAVTRRFLETAGAESARLKGQVVTSVVTGFAGLVALEQLGFAAQFVMILGIVVVGLVVLGLALAFGLGCRDLVRDFVVEYFRSMEEDSSRRPR